MSYPCHDPLLFHIINISISDKQTGLLPNRREKRRNRHFGVTDVPRVVIIKRFTLALSNAGGISMKRKTIALMIASLMTVVLTGCGVLPAYQTSSQPETTVSEDPADTPKDHIPADDESSDEEAFHIGIVTGSFSQSEDDRRGAEAFQKNTGPTR
jgi:hypothetical protein